MIFTTVELAYLAGQRLGRLATVAPDGTPQNSPVGFRHNAATDTIDVHGYNLGASRKFRNVAATRVVSLVVDDIASVDPWQVRGLEIRGEADAVTGEDPPEGYLSPEVIRIRPRRIISWGIDPEAPGMQARNTSL
ncbi:pyridoxamine 5'-phosphate oxidase family protein [Parafrankia irregularis]|uniref:Pyridoxamine 5'-phosphate oxidase family protein n=1 Tax=Parafrankia irregularis TaxID=795642 RepID=A0A0S4QEY8_9ACTN|nr:MULTISPECIES: PPOX class F420-dependent oxidoreductase [Parafrankia]MBE3203339.1 PPOX class F420-dependent oxidoreductase [Parafrankia sp. CH37]CUU54013.1 pyridoxamine 5'-phosphate oxidase family protein [Parafrankia irregularis]